MYLNTNSSGFSKPRVPGDGHVGGQVGVKRLFVEQLEKFVQQQLLVAVVVADELDGLRMTPYIKRMPIMIHQIMLRMCKTIRLS